MNEVSNGASGNKEYVEFVVIDNTVIYDCSATTPPCVDVRGWIFDDNSGYHGSGGVAQGAVRFSNHPLWSCVPVGTIILIYNDGDINPEIPPQDLSLTDGNCRLIVPISSPLFESNSVTPGAVACSYPAAGWTPGGNWSNTLMANSGDCARLVDLSGCEVFSVCWATCNQNNLIYFSSGGSGSQNVWYFNDGDPTLQSNWTEGLAGAAEETPGEPNNAVNQAYIAQFNNNCQTITPTVVSATSTPTGCACTGTATATATGSIPGYSFSWYDASFVSINQNSATATGLCTGNYFVIAESSIGCTDTTMVVITSNSSISVSANFVNVSCNGLSDGTASVTASGGTAPYTYTWSPAPPSGQGTAQASGLSAGTWSCIVTNAQGCSDTASVTLTQPLPVLLNVSPDDTVCLNATHALNASASGGTAPYTYSWSNGATQSTVNVSVSSPQTFTVLATDANGCMSAASSIDLFVFDQPQLILPNDTLLCFGTPFTANALASGGNPPYTYFWSDGSTSSQTTVTFFADQFLSLLLTDACNQNDSDSLLVQMDAGPQLSFSANDLSGCLPLTVLFQSQSANAIDCSWNFGDGTLAQACDTVSHTFTQAGCYDITLSAVASNGCVSSLTQNQYICLVADPIADFVFSPENLINLDPTAQFFDRSIGASSWNWDFAGLATSQQEDTAFTFPATAGGEFEVCLQVANSEGCTDEVCKIITINESILVYVPNAFSPNGDGRNDVFAPIITGLVREFSFFILDRWGAVVFDTNDPASAWNGRYKDGRELVDVYVWKLRLLDAVTNEYREFSGHVSLIK